MPRMAHQRSIYRTGPHHAWAQRKAYHLMKYGRPGFVGLRMVEAWRVEGPGLYRIPPHLALEFIEALKHFRPYADDQDGEVWQ